LSCASARPHGLAHSRHDLAGPINLGARAASALRSVGLRNPSSSRRRYSRRDRAGAARGTEQPATASSVISSPSQPGARASALLFTKDYRRSAASRAPVPSGGLSPSHCLAGRSSKAMRLAMAPATIQALESQARGLRVQGEARKRSHIERARMSLAGLGNHLEARTPPKLPEPARPVSTSEERLSPSA
jgi:hypothetical protein